jgi:hypothetical protein
MGLLFVLLTPTERPQRLRRTTRKQRREQRVSGAEVWKAAAGDGLLLDVELDVFLPLVNRAGGTRLTVLGQLDPWSDGVLHPADRPLLDDELGQLEAAASLLAERDLVVAFRELITRWAARPDRMLHWYGD